MNDNPIQPLAHLQVEQLPVAALKPHPHNARTHSKKQLKQIAASIRSFGFNNPVLIDCNNVIIAGHGRVGAAKLNGLTHVPAIRIEHLSEDQKRAYILADNRIAEKAGWDNAILAIELQHLVIGSGFEALSLGFEMPEIDMIILEATAPPASEDIPEINSNAPTVIVVGDTWIAVRRWQKPVGGKARHAVADQFFDKEEANDR